MNKIVDRESMPYRRCVGVMVLNQDGQVWVGRRVDSNNEGEARGKLWQMPQGGVDKGEDLLEAARRELQEESGITSVEQLGETRDWVVYDLPEQVLGIALKGKYRGQKQKWFAFRFAGQESEINVDEPMPGVKAEFDEWKWVDIETLPDLIVPFKRAAYQQVVESFRHLTGK